jgi:hypothetical protein
MLEIEVFIGLNTKKGFTTMAPVIVQPDPAAAHSGDEIIWHFHSLDDSVKKVEVEFEGKSNAYFENRNHTKTSNKCFTELRGYSKKGSGKHGHLLGTAPSLKYPGSKPSKYTISAYNAKGKEIKSYRLDPVVVTCDP